MPVAVSNRFVVLKRFASLEEANVLKAKLLSEGIPSMVVKEASANQAMGMFLPVRMMVSASDKKRAFEIAETMAKTKKRRSSSLTKIILVAAGPVLIAAGLVVMLVVRNRAGGLVLLIVGLLELALVIAGFVLGRKGLKI